MVIGASGLVIQVVIGACMLLLLVLDGIHLVDARAVVGGVPPEGDVQILQEQVHACTKAKRLSENYYRIPDTKNGLCASRRDALGACCQQSSTSLHLRRDTSARAHHRVHRNQTTSSM